MPTTSTIETMMIGTCQRCRKLVTDSTCDLNCFASHHSNARRPAMPSKQQRKYSPPTGLDRAAEDEDDVAADEERDQHPLRCAVLLLEAIDRFGGHPEEAREPPQRLVSIRPADEVTDRSRQGETNRCDHCVRDRRDAGADGQDQIAIARRQHDQLLGVCVDPVGEDDVGDVGAHDQGNEHHQQVGAVATAAPAAR